MDLLLKLQRVAGLAQRLRTGMPDVIVMRSPSDLGHVIRTFRMKKHVGYAA
jgi:hypothetical protein